MSPGIGSPWKKGVLRQDEDRVNYMESPFGQAMGWLAKAQKNPEFEAHLPFLVGLKGELEWKRGMTHVMLFFGRGCHVLKECLKSFSICPIVKDPTDLLKAFIATAVPRLTNPGGPLRVTTQRLGAEWVGGT